MKENNVIVFSAHPDDAELGMGGVIKNMTSNAVNVIVIDFTDGEPTPMGSPQVRKKESQAAGRLLGFTRRNLGYQNRELVYDTGKKNHLAEIIREYRPSAVFSHYSEDAHPDHVAVSKIIDDAVFTARLTKSGIKGDPFRVNKIYYYFALHLRKIVSPDFFVLLSESEYEAKKKALNCYKSQFIDNGENNHILDFVEARDKYWGYISGGVYAEAFAGRQEIGLRSILDMI